MLIGVSTADDWRRSPTCQVSQAEGLRGGWLALGLESEVRPIACMGLMQARKSGNLWLGQRSRYNALHPVSIRCELFTCQKHIPARPLSIFNPTLARISRILASSINQGKLCCSFFGGAIWLLVVPLTCLVSC